MKDTMKTSLSSRDSIIEGNISPPTIKPHQEDPDGAYDTYSGVTQGQRL